MSRKGLLRLLHVAWAVPCFVVTILLVRATQGHPPGIVFAPAAVAVWGLGHLGLRLTSRLLERGLDGFAPAQVSWPVPIIVALIGSGALSFLGVVFVTAIALNVDRWTLWNGLTAAVLALHTPAFVGLLLRRHWGRRLAAAVAGFWGLLVLYQIFDHLRRNSSVRIWEWPLSLAIILALSWLAWSLLRSPAVVAYFTPTQEWP